ncbi:MAG: hypothetical protein WB511_11470 [Nitrososphaeraceae archaeon]
MIENKKLSEPYDFLAQFTPWYKRIFSRPKQRVPSSDLVILIVAVALSLSTLLVSIYAFQDSKAHLLEFTLSMILTIIIIMLPRGKLIGFQRKL